MATTQLGLADDAETHLGHALKLYLDLGDPLGEAQNLIRLGDTHAGTSNGRCLPGRRSDDRNRTPAGGGQRLAALGEAGLLAELVEDPFGRRRRSGHGS